MHFRNYIQTSSIVSYKNGVVKACGADAARDLEENEKNVAYWFKVTVDSTILNLP
jgi:hypothetical protein